MKAEGSFKVHFIGILINTEARVRSLTIHILTLGRGGSLDG